jgi:hypothetical protein
MITARSKGFQLLDNNIEVLRIGIESLLNKTKGPEWKKNFIRRKGKYYPKFEETENLDYNLLPALVADYSQSFDNGPWLKQKELLELFSSVRDFRNKIAHHDDEFNESSLMILVQSLKKAFTMLNLDTRFNDLDESRTTGSASYIKGAAIPRPYFNNSNRPALQTEESTEQQKSYAEDKNWVYLNNFVIAESKRGLGQMICVEFQRGTYKGRRFLYSHDLVYDACISHLETLDSWKKYGINTSSSGIRKEARAYVKEL